jgi:PTS system N-acetylglucosamine-specific IIC component
MFLAPLLYAMHAVLTGLAMALMDALGVHLGFGFSAGLFDYVLNYSQATRPLLLIPVGLGYFALYYWLFRFFILRFDLKTLGREEEAVAVNVPVHAAAGAPAPAWVSALGSAANLRSVEACTTRLRLVVVDAARFDEPALKALGARGVLKLADGAVQVVVGPIADQLASEIRAELRRVPGPGPGAPADALAALGGRENVGGVEIRASRLCVTVRDPARVDEARLSKAVRALARPAPGSIHLVVGPEASAWHAQWKLS